MIPFNIPPFIGNEAQHVEAAMRSGKLCGDGPYSKKCQTWFEEKFLCRKTLMTPSCTHALEMAAILLDIQPGDEVIMPSYTFVSTANAFALRGSKIIFVDIRPDTMNIDETLIEAAITPQTKAIVPVHYAGVACEMDVIMELALKYNLYVVEDAAQGVSSTYKGKPLGTIGHLGAFSFHETKNYSSGGEGGLLLINDARFEHRSEIIREKGTNRSQFFRGTVDKYSWVDIGSSYLPSELQCAYLWGQLEQMDVIFNNRMNAWNAYYVALKPLEDKGVIILPSIPNEATHNAHMFYIKVNSLNTRENLMVFLKEKGIQTAFHYVPLHSASAGKKFGIFHSKDIHTTRESDKLLRLPLWYGMKDEQIKHITDSVIAFFST